MKSNTFPNQTSTIFFFYWKVCVWPCHKSLRHSEQVSVWMGQDLDYPITHPEKLMIRCHNHRQLKLYSRLRLMIYSKQAHFDAAHIWMVFRYWQTGWLLQLCIWYGMDTKRIYIYISLLIFNLFLPNKYPIKCDFCFICYPNAEWINWPSLRQKNFNLSDFGCAQMQCRSSFSINNCLCIPLVLCIKFLWYLLLQ